MNEVFFWLRKADDKRRTEVGISLDVATQGKRAEAFPAVVRQDSFPCATGYRYQMKADGNA